MYDGRAAWHVRNDRHAFLDGLKLLFGFWWNGNGDSLALPDIEDAMVAKKWNLLGFAIFLLLEYFPEHNRKRFLTFFDATF